MERGILIEVFGCRDSDYRATESANPDPGRPDARAIE
jgi:hypothetical protein